MLLKPAAWAFSTALKICSLLWMRPRNLSLSSKKLCAPKLMRFAPKFFTCFSQAKFAEFGFASNVISVLGVQSGAKMLKISL